MKAETIRRKLVEMGCDPKRAESAALKYGDESGIPTPSNAIQKALARDARRKRQLQWQREFRVYCRANDLPLPVFEFKFHPKRYWRADVAWPHPDGGGVLLEVDGGGHVRGRHHRAKGFAADQTKRNAAIELGYKPLHCTPQTVYGAALMENLKTLLGVA